MCGVKAKMGKFERYCGIPCRNKATRMDVNAHGIKFRQKGVDMLNWFMELLEKLINKSKQRNLPLLYFLFL